MCLAMQDVIGSSPRGRGKRSRRTRRGRFPRLIPAWAGKTARRARGRGVVPAHPRVGGENTMLTPETWALVGSSPRGRGKRPASVYLVVFIGLIPAWAGKTTGVALSATETGGSSPRGRGKRSLVLPASWSMRLIPAWAGKTEAGDEKGSTFEAHPRVGGENEETMRPKTFAGGSSPRGRGKRQPSRLCHRRSRLIPAWAGKTAVRRGGGHVRPAHPRVGGENGEKWDTATPRGGSSPRGRGKPGQGSCYRAWVRLIPAWAGKTWSMILLSVMGPAHPRVGGENAIITDPPYGIAGSSPRGRGKQSAPAWEQTGRGLIPAWAGKTLPAN